VKLVLWAPLAETVEVVAGRDRFAMRRDDADIWSLELEAATLQDGYRFSLDGGEPLPDPRSAWQRDGVHGPSYPVDLRALRERSGRHFRAPALSEAVIYELHVGTFTAEGTYSAACAKLAHLATLGVTHVELMPIATFPGARGWGYDGVDLYAPYPPYGTPEELAAFIDACHERGLAVLLDVVYNHFGPDGNYWPAYAPYLTERVKTAWGAAVNYDGPHSDMVRRYVIDNALMWLRDYHFDGLRLDAVHAIFSVEAVHPLEELAGAVRQLAAETNRSLVLIAESDANDPRLVRTPQHGGYHLDAHWIDDFHHSVHRVFTGESGGYYADFDGLPDLARALSEAYVYQGQYSRFRQRRHGRPPLWVSPDQLVVCAQNHDQIGNRAFGERLSMLLPTAALKAVAALTILSPFIPLLFQGEEWGAATPFLYFTDHQDRELAAAVAAGRRREFASFDWQAEIPNPQDDASFERSKLQWTELEQPAHAELLSWYRALIRIRRNKPHWSRPTKPDVRFDTERGWLLFVHAGVLAQFNLSPDPQPVPLPAGSWRLSLSSAADDNARENLPPVGTRIFVLR
jgi:maltooligosyltrehalose trehalohydrolase